MPKLSVQEYEELKIFFGYFSERFLNTPGFELIARLEKTFPSKAAAGLWMAVNDCLEMTEPWGIDRVCEADAELREHGVLTLSELRLRVERRRAGVLAKRTLKKASRRSRRS